MASDTTAFRDQNRHSRAPDSPSRTRANRVRSASPTRSRNPDPSSPAPRPSRPARSSRGRNTIPPCDRCRSFKKKCSRTFPACTLCASSSQTCSYSAPPATPEVEALQLRARVQWLSEFINGHLLKLSHVAGIEDLETGSDLASLLDSLPNTNPEKPAVWRSQIQAQDGVVAMPSSNLSQTEYEASMLLGHVDSRGSGLGPPDFDVPIGGNCNTSTIDGVALDRHLSHEGSASTNAATSSSLVLGQGLSADTTARRFVDAYFRNVNGAYPFVNQARILKNLEAFGDFAQRLRDSQSTLLYLVMSIGCTTLQRANQVSGDIPKQFEVAYAEIIQECVCRDSIESVQIFMLLALYSLFDPVGASPYSIVGIAARQAIKIGLTRRPTDEDTYAPAEAELRHRLYWSIFALDRMMAVSQGLPVALADNEHVPYPSLTVDEFASADRITYARKLQISRHVIQLRQLEGRILQQIHFGNEDEIAKLVPLDKRAILRSLRAQIEDWYRQGCLMGPIGGDRVTIHSSTIWLSARYYYLLVLLYYPNHFNLSAAAVSQQDLQRLAQRQLQATSELFQQQQLPLNCNTLYRLMPICLVLMHNGLAICSSANWSAQSMSSSLAKDEVAIALSVLEAFPEKWDLAHRAERVVRRFAGIISGNMTAFFSDDEVLRLGTIGNINNMVDVAGENHDGKELSVLMKSCIARLTLLVQEMLGQSTCFQYVEYQIDNNKRTDCMSPAMPYEQSFQHYQFQQQQAPPPMMTQVTLNRSEMGDTQQASLSNNNITDYSWGGIDLDFL